MPLRIKIIPLVVGLLIALAVRSIFFNGETTHNEEPPQNTAPVVLEGQIGLVLDERGLITRTFSSETTDPVVWLVGASVVVLPFYDADVYTGDFLQINEPVIINQEERRYSDWSTLEVSISFDDAVLYYNYSLLEGRPLTIDPYVPLELTILADVAQRVRMGFEVGNIPAFELATDGLPTIAYNEEVIERYLADPEAIAERERAANADGKCPPDYILSEEQSNVCVNYNIATDGTQPWYSFSCIDYTIVALNWEQVRAAIVDTVDNSLVVFELQLQPYTTQSELPCEYHEPQQAAPGVDS